MDIKRKNEGSKPKPPAYQSNEGSNQVATEEIEIKCEVEDTRYNLEQIFIPQGILETRNEDSFNPVTVKKECESEEEASITYEDTTTEESSRNHIKLENIKDSTVDNEYVERYSEDFYNTHSLIIKNDIDIEEHSLEIKEEYLTKTLDGSTSLAVKSTNEKHENIGKLKVLKTDISKQLEVGNQMSYESEQRKLLALFEKPSCGEERESSQELDSSDEELTDQVSERSEDSNTEQELSSNEEEEEETDKLFYIGKDGVTKWSSQHPTNVCKSENIKVDPGVKPVGRGAKTEFDCWQLFISDEMMETILCHTNAKIKKRQSVNKEPSHAYLLKETSMDELLALFGLLYIASLNRSNRQNMSDLWRSDGTGVDIFRTTMSIHRFYFLRSCLQFDDAATRDERKSVDNLAPIRSIFKEFVSNCQNIYNPSEYLTVDKMMEYIPKYIKMYALVDAKIFYTVNLEIDASKQPERPFSQSNKPFDIVNRLVRPISKTNRNITFDNWFTSVPLVKHLLTFHKLTSTGTLRKNKKEIPPSFISTRGHVNTSLFAFHKDMILVSYRPKKSKVVLALSSLQRHQRIDSSDDKKPEIITFYNSTKSGVDIVDELCATCDVSHNSKRWPMTVFYTVMNIAAINSLIVYRENNNSSTSRRDFIRKLGLAMLERQLCVKNMENLPRELRKRIHEQTEETLTYPPTKTAKTYTRCKACPSAKDRKTKHACKACNKPICMKHIISLCHSCIGLNSD